MLILVAYDITNEKRLRRVARLMEGYGTRVQRSVFECRVDQARLGQLIERLKGVMKRREDRVHIYHLCGACQQRFAEFGRGSLVTDAEIYLC